MIIRGCCFTRTSAVIGYLRRPLRAPSGLLCGVIIRRPSANSPEDNQSRCCVADLCRSQFCSVSAQESKAGFPPKHRPPRPGRMMPAGTVPTMLPTAIALVTRPRNFSLKPQSSR